MKNDNSCEATKVSLEYLETTRTIKIGGRKCGIQALFANVALRTSQVNNFPRQIKTFHSWNNINRWTWDRWTWKRFSFGESGVIKMCFYTVVIALREEAKSKFSCWHQKLTSEVCCLFVAGIDLNFWSRYDTSQTAFLHVSAFAQTAVTCLRHHEQVCPMGSTNQLGDCWAQLQKFCWA